MQKQAQHRSNVRKELDKRKPSQSSLETLSHGDQSSEYHFDSSLHSYKPMFEMIKGSQELFDTKNDFLFKEKNS